jgi:hypothetical protein
MAAAALPEEVLAAVLALLSPPELARAACVCRSWCVAAASSVLWQAAFLRTFEPAEAAELVRRAAPGAPDWRAALAERYRAGAGWRDGRCRTYTLKAANRLGDLFCISDDHLICCNEDGARARRVPRARAATPVVRLTPCCLCLQARSTCGAWSAARAASGGPPGC